MSILLLLSTMNVFAIDGQYQWVTDKGDNLVVGCQLVTETKTEDKPVQECIDALGTYYHWRVDPRNTKYVIGCHRVAKDKPYYHVEDVDVAICYGRFDHSYIFNKSEQGLGCLHQVAYGSKIFEELSAAECLQRAKDYEEHVTWQGNQIFELRKLKANDPAESDRCILYQIENNKEHDIHFDYCKNLSFSNPAKVAKVVTHQDMQNLMPLLSIDRMKALDSWVQGANNTFYEKSDRYIFHYMFHDLKAVHLHMQLPQPVDQRSCGFLAQAKAKRYAASGGYLRMDAGDGLYAFPDYAGESSSWGGGRFQHGDKICVTKIKKDAFILDFGLYQRAGYWGPMGKEGLNYLYLAHKIDGLLLAGWPFYEIMNPDIIDVDGSFYLDFGDKKYGGNVDAALLTKLNIDISKWKKDH